MEYVYGALLLHKLGQAVNEENLRKVIEAAGGQVDESKLKSLIASLQGVDISAELENASALAAAPAASSGAEPEKEEKKEEKKEEGPSESAAGLSALFG